MKEYRKKNTLAMEPWHDMIDMEGVSVSKPDAARGSPKPGDMIATNPQDVEDRWLVSAKFFYDNYEAV